MFLNPTLSLGTAKGHLSLGVKDVRLRIGKSKKPTLLAGRVKLDLKPKGRVALRTWTLDLPQIAIRSRPKRAQP
jgi:hypothetical protein